MRKTTRILALALALLGGAVASAAPGGARRAKATRPTDAPLVVSQDHGARQGHKHQWNKTTKKVWVPEVRKKVIVGYDKDGNPIIKEVVVTPGHFKTVVVFRCACGAERGG